MTRIRTHAAQERRWRRGDLLVALGAIALGAVLASIIMSIQSLQKDLVVANEARDALATQVRGLGATPIAGEPGSRGEVGPSGPPGPQGEKGDPGESGEPAPTLIPSPGPQGRQGVQGVQGLPGTPGSDSTVPGPSGLPGASGAPGKDGVDGKDGADGADGADGRDGAPPVGWTYTDTAGVQHRCTQATPFDPAAPRYTCSPVATGTPLKGVMTVNGLVALLAYRRFGVAT